MPDTKRYFKGKDKEGQRTIYEVYNEPQKSLLGLFHDDCKDSYTVVRYYLDKQAKEYFKDIKTARKQGEIFSREISKEEFDIYSTIQTILDETYMNQFTGGFPRKETLERCADDLRREVRRWNPDDMSFAEAMANSLSSFAKTMVEES